MQFDDEFGPAFTALSIPHVDGLTQPTVQPTAMFGGGIPAVQFAPVTPIHFGLVSPLHGPEFKPVYEAHPVHAHFQAAQLHAIVGHALDIRG